MYIILAYLNHRSHEQGPAPWGSVPIIGKAIPPFHPPAWGRERGSNSIHLFHDEACLPIK